VSLGFDFFRHPAVTGTEVRLYDGDNGNMIREPAGIVSLSLVRVASYTGSTYSSLAATDWRLRWPAFEGGPYLAVLLTGVANYPRFYAGYDTIELTGVFGYAAIPEDIEQATLMWAADLYRLGPGGGSPLSSTGEGEQSGLERFIGRPPPFAWETIEDYRKRHAGALVA
ncbi:MAG: hypothetical protein LC798_08825, partial [Chloroflexi bacterium]|nr:hypothetical protein [Chloroflexota bacterium]